MKNFIIFIGIFLLVGFLFSYLYGKQQQESVKNSALLKANNFDKNRLQASHELKLLEFKHQGMKFNLGITCVNINGEKISLTNIIAKGKKLVFCIPESVCNTCHENTFKQLNGIANLVGSSNMVVLVDSPRLRATVVEFRDRGSDIPIFGVNYNNLNFDIHYVPFLFILSENATCENLFVPNSFDLPLTQSYITAIKKRYFL